MINGYIITVKNDSTAVHAAGKLKQTAPKNVNLQDFDAVTKKRVSVLLKGEGIEWNYPWQTEEFDIKSGLIKKPYPTAVKEKRIGCFLSHYLLWKRCIKYDEPIIIHEHDAIYYSDEELPLEQFAKSQFNIIGLNDPRKATRLAELYDRQVQEQQLALCRAPLIDQHMVPQGIAGNSAYYIEPVGAQKMLSLVKEYGAWPNDALMCRQLVPTLGQTKKYYTYVQGLQSTTSR